MEFVGDLRGKHDLYHSRFATKQDSAALLKLYLKAVAGWNQEGTERDGKQGCVCGDVRRF
jgi:hypothetical protein